MRKHETPPLTNGRTDKTTEAPINVLCVDDEASFLASTKQLLELDTSFHVDLASSINDALEKMRSKVFDVVVSDYQMPGRNGLEFLKELRESGNDIPFILFTGKGREEVAVKALNLGADRYFNKFGNPETVYGQLVYGIRQAVAQRRAEKEIWDREERLRAIFSSSPDGMFTSDLNGIITDCNLETLKLVEASSISDIVGKHFQTFVVKEEKEKVDSAFREVLEKGFVTSRETKLLTKNEAEVPVGFSASILRDAYGKPVGAVALVRNISDRKRAEAKLLQSESKFRGFFENSPDYCYIISPEGKIVAVSKTVLDSLDYSKDELLGKPLISTVYAPSSRQKAKKLFEKWKKTGKIQNEELEIVTKQGKRRAVLLNAHSIHDIDGRLLHSVSVQKDITEHKKADEALRKSEEKYRGIVELSPDGIATMNLKGTITSVNKAFLDLTGFSKDEIVGKHFTKMGTLRLQDIPKYTKLVYSILRGKNPGPFEFDYLRKDGTQRLGQARISVMEENGKKIGLQAILADITERKQMEQELKDSVEKYRRMVEQAPDSIMSFDLNGLVTSCNATSVAMTGHSKEELIGKRSVELASLRKEDLPKFIKLHEQMLKGKMPEPFEVNFHDKDGNPRFGEVHMNLMKKGNKATGFQAIIRDITEKKKAEKAVSASVEKYRRMVEQAPDSIMSFDLNGLVTSCNATSVAMTGHSKEEMIGKRFSELGTLNKAQIQKITNSIPSILEGAVPEPFEVVGRNEDGSSAFGEVHISLIKEGEKITGFQTITRDVTERKKTEMALRESEKRFRELSELLPEVIFETDSKGFLKFVNHEAYTQFGYSHEEFESGLHAHQMLVPEDRGRAREAMRKVMNGEKTGSNEYTALRKDGTTFPIIVNSTPIIHGNKVMGIRGIMVDITERKKAEEALRESERRFRELSELLPEVIFEIDLTGVITFVNRGAFDLLGFSEQDLEKGLNLIEMLTPESQEKAKESLDKLLCGKDLGAVEYTIVKKDGTTIPCIAHCSLIVKESKPVGIRGIIVEITERKKAEDSIKDTLKKMETLNEKLSVIGRLTRHDSRNKLAVIANNAYLAKNKLAPDNSALENLGDIESAVDQMIKIFDFARNYELLGTEELSYVDVKKSFDEAFLLLSCPDNVKPVIECDGLKVWADSLLRQIFYNLIDNSVKYGEIVSRIKVYCKEEKNSLKLVYEDDGVGIPAGEKEKIFVEGYGKGTGYGLYLIRKICEDYGWTIKETGVTGEGIQFTMTIPKINKSGEMCYRLD
ncbi:MAG: PAS domain S-box protein [Candidatus Bathyarchaeota archaeon]|jgi:PAS domain S-box-containing protein